MGRLDHRHAVHDHRGVMGLGGVEDKVQPALGGQRPRADGGQRPLTATQQAAGREDRHETCGLYPHRRRHARGHGMPSGSEQHAQHGEHRRAHAPHRQGHTHGT
ncbi:hypothetical protein [Streptomyces sp. NRRL B-3648]|uniref:hypothetical protein n=1 Tax=Streptomyces sp. NRRL B-3648 TaxID=1519493 RepID=UPI00131DBFFE|nr:hypothetical protein [Streptomyces sp. NRRL B-3648]